MDDDRSPLDAIHVPVPCHVSWNGMRGDDRTRFCSQCRLNVYHLTGMTRVEAEALIRENEGNLCVRFYRRRDGTVLTRDCSTLVGAIRWRLEWALAAIATMVPLLGGCASSVGQLRRPDARLPLEQLGPREFPQAEIFELREDDAIVVAVRGKRVQLGRTITFYLNGKLAVEAIVESASEEEYVCLAVCRPIRGELAAASRAEYTVWVERADYRR